MRFSSEGFFLVDSLLAVFILSAVCILCFSIFNLIGRYERGYQNYQERSNLHYEQILPQLNHCEGCLSDESD